MSPVVTSRSFDCFWDALALVARPPRYGIARKGTLDHELHLTKAYRIVCLVSGGRDVSAEYASSRPAVRRRVGRQPR